MMTLESGRTYFQILETLGEGLNSCVYTAIRKDVSGTINHKVAVKILKSQNSVDFWRQEVESLLKVDSPHCVKVLDFEWLQGKPALILEWVDGLTLAQLHQHAQLDSTLFKEIFLQVQEGLLHLHKAELCHGDLNMNNVMVSNSGQIKLLDFGRANVARFQIQGSPEYMAPEVKDGKTPDFWSDLYSLGVLSQRLDPEFAMYALCSSREHRDLIPGSSTPQIRKTLAQLVLATQQRINRNHKSGTMALSIPKPKTNFFRNLAMTIASSLIIPNAAGQRPLIPGPCLVQIRTKKWVHIQSKYSPTEFKSQNCEPLILNWSSENKRGVLKVHFQSQQLKFITDSDLGL